MKRWLAAVPVCLLLAAPPSPAQEAEEKAAAAAQKAAEAAQAAAEAAARSAAAIEKVAAALSAAPAPPGPAAAAAAPPAAAWTGLVSLGMIALTGNSESVTFKLGGSFERKSPEWIWGIKASAVYGQQRAAGSIGDAQISALGAGIQLRGDRRFTPMLSAYVLLGDETDHVKSIEQRPVGEIGASLLWWEQKEADYVKSSLKTDLGFRYGREFRFQYYPLPLKLANVTIAAPHAAGALRYALSKDVIFTQDVDVAANVVDQSRALIGAISKLAARLTGAVSLGVSFAITYDSAPAAGRQNTDTALTVGLDVGL